VHRYVLDELLKLFAAGDEIAFAIDLDENNQPFRPCGCTSQQRLLLLPGPLFARLSHALLAKDIHRLILVAVCFDKGVFTSTIPAPDFSRNDFTAPAVISAITYSKYDPINFCL
jgi:hypothetical protein